MNLETAVQEIRYTPSIIIRNRLVATQGSLFLQRPLSVSWGQKPLRSQGPDFLSNVVLNCQAKPVRNWAYCLAERPVKASPSWAALKQKDGLSDPLDAKTWAQK